MDYTWIYPIIAGAIRNIGGWFETSLADGKIQAYEWGLLGKTLIEVVVIALAAHFGLGTDLIQSSGLAILGSLGISTAKKIGS